MKKKVTLKTTSAAKLLEANGEHENRNAWGKERRKCEIEQNTKC